MLHAFLYVQISDYTIELLFLFNGIELSTDFFCIDFGIVAHAKFWQEQSERTLKNFL